MRVKITNHIISWQRCTTVYNQAVILALDTRIDNFDAPSLSNQSAASYCY